MDPVFINEGGSAVDGVYCINSTNTSLTKESFLTLKREYRERFGNELPGQAQLTYEAALILFDALSKTDDPKKLKDVILKQRVFNLIDSKIIFDKYGDSYRALYVMEIQNGKIQEINRIEAEELLINEDKDS